MSNGELVVWAGMSGAIALLCLIAVADWFVQRTLAAARALAFVLTMGGSAVVLSGLLEQMIPALDSAATLPLRASIGPLSGALALSYLGVWLGAGRDEPLTRWIVFVGSLILVVVSVALAVFAGRAGETVTMIIFGKPSSVGMVIISAPLRVIKYGTGTQACRIAQPRPRTCQVSQHEDDHGRRRHPTSRAKGLSQFQIIWRHALRNALNPVVTIISGWFAGLLAGAVFVEYIFGWNGLGKEIVEALNNLDLPVIMGSVIVIATTFVVINILVDLVYAYLDPKIRLS